MQGAKELDCNLIIVPGHYINADYNDKVRTKNKYQYNSLFSYINNNNIDALIVSLGTIANTLSDDEKNSSSVISKVFLLPLLPVILMVIPVLVLTIPQVFVMVSMI